MNTSAVKTFRTRKEAKATLETMNGWEAKVTLMFLPWSAKATKSGNVFVIECKKGNNDPLYLRENGYIN